MFPAGVDWRNVGPGDYSDAVFACGPLHGEQLDALVDRFPACRRTAIDVSLTPGTQPDFDVVFERDGDRTARPDLAIASPREPVHLVGVVRAHAQPEYGDAADLDEVRATIDEALAGERVAIVELDTRVDHGNRGSRPVLRWRRRSRGQTRRRDPAPRTRDGPQGGTPVHAVDPAHGGGKVTAQARALDWPHVRGVDDLRVEGLRSTLRVCLAPEAPRQATECRDRAQEQVRRLGEAVVQSLTERHQVA